MEKISILCFSLTGYETGKKLAGQLQNLGKEVLLAGKSKYIPDSIPEGHVEWTGKQFQTADAIIFIGACGIAVRSISPFLINKKLDPAVLVLDECGKFAISLLSGHLGGANELTQEVADILGSIPVITTATDLHKRFAVDVFAKKNHCEIFPMNAAKEFSAALLRGETLGFYSDYPWEGKLPAGICICGPDGSICKENRECAGNEKTGDAENPRIGMAVSMRKDCSPFPVTVHIVPQIISLGIGCKKGKSVTDITKAVAECMTEAQIYIQAVETVASIDLKKDEPGLLEFTKKLKRPFLTFSEEELKQAEGDFSVSEFVKTVTGVDNVCERSCILAIGQGKLIQKKKARDGVTTALAVKDWSVHFE